MFARIALATLALALGLGAGAAHADTTTFATAGAWRAFGGTSNDGTSVCGVVVSGSERSLHIKHYGSDNGFTVQMFKQTWAIPNGTEIPMRLQIDSRSPWTVTARGYTVKGGGLVEFSIKNQLTTFMEEFREGLSLRVSFLRGTETDWVASLNGTAAISQHFARCLSVQLQRAAPTQPFDAQPTQPFENRSPPQRTQPFAEPSGTAGRT
jgi:hypothetical protein